MHKIQRLSENQARAIVPDLVALLQDILEGGASVGFIPPLTSETAEAYWREILVEIAQGKRILLVASEGKELTGSVQLSLVTKQNGLHRAEVQKLIVHTRFRKRGVARALLSAVEDVARQEGRTLLVLDTEEDSVAEKLYTKHGYTRAAVIPKYARNAAGALHNVVFFYRLI
jgi:ribosomal protein S18 acetylase RimI-like enzyme